MGTVVIYGLIIANITAFSKNYASIGMTFVMTYCFKLLIKSAGEKEKADVLGIGGYVLTIGEVVKLFNAMKKSGFQGDPEQAQNIVGGILGKVLQGGTDIIKNFSGK